LPTITFQNKSYKTKKHESVLDALLRHEVDIPYACKAGVCHVCVMVCDDGELDLSAVEGLRDIQIENGYFLSCQCIPEHGLSVKNADESGLFSRAKVIAKEAFTEDVCRFRLKTATQLYYRAGQFINIKKSNGQIRSYSLASLPTQDDFLELHIKRMRNGQLSNWLFDDVQVEDVLEIQGPYGDCFYQPGHLDSDILMIATGTGLAPLIGILREAVEAGHRGKISLYHGDRDFSGLYLHEELKSLAIEHHNIEYFPCVSGEVVGAEESVFNGRASELAFINHDSLIGHLVYLCGSPEMVDYSRTKSLDKGAEANKVYADPFVTKDLRLGRER